MKRLFFAAWMMVVALAMLLHARTARAELAKCASEVCVERAVGADACPDPKTFAARVREGRSSSSPSGGSTSSQSTRTVTVRFERTSSGYASAVRTSDGMERALDDRAASGCDGLAEATLLAVRLAFDVPEPTTTTTTSAPLEPTTTKDAADIAPKAGPDRHPTHPEVLAGGLATFGIGGSGLAPGARVTGVLTLGAEALWSIGATGFVLAPRTESVGVGEVEVGVFGGGIDACRRHSFDSAAGFLVGLCGRAELARLSGQARGFVKNEEASRPLFTGSLLLRGQRRFIGPIGLFAELGGVVPIIRERFEIQGIGRVYDPPLMAATGAIGALVDFE